ncbi:MAG: MFS transporter [Acidimicrobiales bacterium]
MTQRTYDPARIFVRGGGIAEGIEWAFWLAITVYWIVELELGPLQLVMLGVVLEGSVLLAETPTGVVADVYSRKRSLIISQFVMGLGFIIAVVSTNYWIVLPAQAIFGVGWTFRSGADTAWVTDELKGIGDVDDDDIERLLLRKHRFGMVVGVGSLLFTMVVGTAFGVRWAAAAMGLAAIGLGFYYLQAMREDHFTPGHEHERGFVETLRGGIAAVSGRPRLRVLVLVILVFEMGSDGFDRLGFKHFLDNGGYDDDSLIALGVLFVILALAGLAVNHVASGVLDAGHGVARLAVGLLALATIGGLIVAVTNIVIVIAVGYMIQDSVREALWPTLEGWANRDAPTEVRATVHSLMGQTTAIAELFGGLMLGLLAEATSIQVSLVAAAVLWAMGAAIATRGVAPKAKVAEPG